MGLYADSFPWYVHLLNCIMRPVFLPCQCSKDIISKDHQLYAGCWYIVTGCDVIAATR